MTARLPKPGTQRRIDIEQAIARGVPNSRLMADHRLTYEQLRAVMAEMADVPESDEGRVSRSIHGTESAYRTHQRRKQRPCDACFDAHTDTLQRQRAARRAADADRRYRGVA